MGWEFDHVHLRNSIEGRPGVKGELAAWSEFVTVASRLIRGSDSLWRSGAVQRRAIQIALSRVARRGHEIDIQRVDANQTDEIGVETTDKRWISDRTSNSVAESTAIVFGQTVE